MTPFVRPTNRVPARLPIPTEPLPKPGWENLYNSLADAGDLVGEAVRAVVGHPEKLLEGNTSALQTPFGVITYPEGAPDALADLPIFGGIIKGVEKAEPFFSALRKTIEEHAPSIGLPEHFLNIARKGSKAEELEWSGLEPFLRSMSGKKVSKAQVLEHLETNAPELREAMISTKALTPSEEREFMELGPNGARTPEQNARYAELRDKNNSMTVRPKFTQYALPGGTNQRELVVTLPGKERKDDAFFNWIAGQDLDLGNGHVSHFSEDPITAYNQFFLMSPNEQRDWRIDFGRAQDNFTEEELGDATRSKDRYNVPSLHAYGDPELDENRLFHARFNDRVTDAGENALHMEELQSDWHQAGRKEGYNTPPTLPPGWSIRKFETPEDLEDSIVMIGGQPEDNEYKVGDWALENENGELHDIAPGHLSREDAVRHFANRDNGGTDAVELGLKAGGVPDAPYKTTWHELGMRRALQEAAEGNYDRLTWTTGKQQADRYSLAKHVDSLSWEPYPRDTGVLRGYKNGQEILNHHLKPSELPDYVGQDAAKKLLEAESPLKVGEQEVIINGKPTGEYNYNLTDQNGRHRAKYQSREEAERHAATYPRTISGVDLDVGGQGMRGFYDEILPAYMKKYGKKWGVAPEKVKIETGFSDKALGDAIRKEAAMDFNSDSAGRQLLNEIASHVELGKTPNDAIRDLKALGHPATRDYELLSKVRKTIDKLPKKNYEEVWSMKITPQMREDLLGSGQPLFSAPPFIRPSREPEKNRR